MIGNIEYVLQMKKFILNTLNELFNENILDDQVKREYLKYRIRKYTIKFSKELAKNTNKTIADLETKLKDYGKHENYVDSIDYKFCRQQLDEIYEEKEKGIKKEVNATGMSMVKNPLIFFFNLEKHCANKRLLASIHKAFLNQE